MSGRIESELKVAEFLLQIKSVVLNSNEPFTWASGIKSPIYCDNRKILSYPQVRTYVRQELVRLINEEYGTPNVIAGVATGGIAMGALVAEELGIPFIYVRSTPKQHGLSNQIEGVLEEGQSVVVVEDLVSTGGSSLQAVEALRKAKASVKGMVSIFTYGFDVAKQNFEKADCKLASLTNYDSLLKQALNTRYITENEIEALKEWRKNPQDWKGVNV